MSTMTFGPPIVLDDGHRPVAPPHSLLKTPGVLKDIPDEHWLSGATVYPYPDELPQTFDPCSTGTFREKAEGSGVTSESFAAFVVYLPITCSSISIGDPEEFMNRAEIAMDAVESFAVEQQLSQGVAIATNPFFAMAGVALPAGAGAVSPATALAWLEEAIGATGKQGMIHTTPGPISHWFGNRRESLSAVLEENLALVTANGNRVVSGGGYAGATPSGGGAAAGGQSWAYATGPVEVRHSAVQIPDISEVLDRSINEVTFRAERYVLATWTADPHAAVLIDWSP